MAAPSDPPSLTPLFQEPEPPEPLPHPSIHTASEPPSRSRRPPSSSSSSDHAPSPGPSHPPLPGSPDKTDATIPVVIVDGANVVGSVPDGWWRDRAGAAIRLRDSLAAVPAAGLPDVPAPVEVVLVVEGKARDIPQDPGGVRIERAPGSGDDKIVDLVRETAATRRTIVVTADRGLRDRVTVLGAEVRGPSSVPR
ncbi:hypothetical protein SAMN05421541_103439 [Actinoplanes philippinensis]|uniref:YacP-like NYN domain-containing protein n=1 Tax=Actinoplanes philippinensis TaxID=35752 RepID=A0A1I2D6B1_9ACTN|nr:hypothetical protein SAMN05421541_103439 [Actinoplanes philippinensis]